MRLGRERGCRALGRLLAVEIDVVYAKLELGGSCSSLWNDKLGVDLASVERQVERFERQPAVVDREGHVAGNIGKRLRITRGGRGDAERCEPGA